MLGKLIGWAVFLGVVLVLLVRYVPGVALVLPADLGKVYNSLRIVLNMILPDITQQGITDFLNGTGNVVGSALKSSNSVLDGAASVARNENAFPGLIGILAVLLAILAGIAIFRTYKSGGIFGLISAPFGFFKNLSKDKFWTVLLGLVGVALLGTSAFSIFWVGTDNLAKQQAAVLVLIGAVLYFGYENIDEFVRNSFGTFGIYVVVGLLLLGAMGGLLGLSAIQPVLDGASGLVGQGVNFLFQIPMAIVRVLQGMQTQVLLFGLGIVLVLVAYVAKDFGHSEHGPAMMPMMAGNGKKK